MIWEYKTIGLNVTGLQKKLNELGQDRWELISLTNTGVVLDHMLAVFKRPSQ